MKITNKGLSAQEIEWLSTMLSENTPICEKLIAQINQSVVRRDISDYYYSIYFKVEKAIGSIISYSGVPIEMRVFIHDPDPAAMQFLLHVGNGYISELEIFNADLSVLDFSFSLKYIRKEIILEKI